MTIVQHLSKALAETYTLYLKTQNYHWNVKGPHFNALHTMFQTQYEDMALAIDDIAERIRALGEDSPGTFNKFSELSSIKEAKSGISAEDMVEDLTHSHEALSRTLAAAVSAAEEAGDAFTADLLTGRIGVHDKTAWMLRSSLPQ